MGYWRVATTARVGAADRAVRARLGAGAVALSWAFFFFGIIDLLVGVIPSQFPEFLPFVVLETSWGLLYTFLLPVPLIAWAARPAGWVGPQVAGIAAAVFAAGVAAGAWGQVFVAFLVAASAAFPRMWRPWPKWSLRRALARPAFWPVDALVALAMAAALVHTWEVLDAARSGASDDETWYLMHLPMQAAFALAVPAAAAVAVLAMANGVAGWWFAIVPPAGCAMWYGAVSRGTRRSWGVSVSFPAGSLSHGGSWSPLRCGPPGSWPHVRAASAARVERRPHRLDRRISSVADRRRWGIAVSRAGVLVVSPHLASPACSQRSTDKVSPRMAWRGARTKFFLSGHRLPRVCRVHGGCPVVVCGLGRVRRSVWCASSGRKPDSWLE